MSYVGVTDVVKNLFYHVDTIWEGGRHKITTDALSDLVFVVHHVQYTDHDMFNNISFLLPDIIR